MTVGEQIKGFQDAAAKIVQEIMQAQSMPKAEREMRENDCCARLVPIYQTLHHLTKQPDDHR